MASYPALVAAAGGSSRCPEGKLLKSWRGRPLLAWLLETLVEHPRVGQIVVITGHRSDEVEQLSREFDCIETHHNQDWPSGVSSSLKLGESRLPPGDGFLVALGDCPLFRPETLSAVLPTAEIETVNVPTYQGQSGHPVFIPEWARADWSQMRGDQGARQLFAGWADRLRYCPVDDPGSVRDFDLSSDFSEADSARPQVVAQ